MTNRSQYRNRGTSFRDAECRDDKKKRIGPIPSLSLYIYPNPANIYLTFTNIYQTPFIIYKNPTYHLLVQKSHLTQIVSLASV